MNMGEKKQRTAHTHTNTWMQTTYAHFKTPEHRHLSFDSLVVVLTYMLVVDVLYKIVSRPGQLTLLHAVGKKSEYRGKTRRNAHAH